MTKDIWTEILGEEVDKLMAVMQSFGPISPGNWRQMSALYRAYLDVMDEATTVYEMENRKHE